MNLDICNKIAEKILADGNHSENAEFIGNLFAKDDNKYAMSFLFTKDGIEELPSYLKPFIDETVDTDMYNAFYLNALVIKNNNCIVRHVDTTLSDWVGHITIAKKVSVLYLRVPDDMVGGQLNLFEESGVKRIRPETGKLTSFSGETPHSVNSTFTDHERISLVLESYYLTEDEISKLPKFDKGG